MHHATPQLSQNLSALWKRFKSLSKQLLQALHVNRNCCEYSKRCEFCSSWHSTHSYHLLQHEANTQVYKIKFKQQLIQALTKYSNLPWNSKHACTSEKRLTIIFERKTVIL
jgi:hypothetical protein